MTKCLITGCGGFIGSHLAEFLLQEGMAVYGTVHRNTRCIDHLKGSLNLFNCDILDRGQVESILADVKPDFVFHLAAQSLVTPSRQDPEKTFNINILGTLYLLDAIGKAGIEPLTEVICSSAEYGFTLPEEIPIPETREFRPTSPYGVSKVAEDMLAYLYWKTYGMRIIRVRPFFVIGPRKESDVCSDFARGIVEIEHGRRALLEVGNLEAVRDFVDVRNAVRAFWLLAKKGTSGEVYNIASGQGHRIRDILDKLVNLSSRPVDVRQNPALMRPSDDPVVIGDNTKITALGWRPQVGLEKTLLDILEYWRKRYSTD